MNNYKIRQVANRYGVYLWELARFMNCSESTLYRRLREQFSENEEREWIHAIEMLAALEPEKRPTRLFEMTEVGGAKNAKNNTGR